MKRFFGGILLPVAITIAAGIAPTVARAQSPADLVVDDIRVSRRQVRPGGVVRVSMTLRNRGPVVAHSQPPAPSTVYAQNESFAQKGFAARDDRFSIVMTASGPRGREWPWRWGIGGDLPLGQTRRVSYPVRLTTPGIYTLFVGVALGEQVRRLPAPYLRGIEVVAPGQSPQTRRGLINPTPPTRVTVNGKEVALDQRPVFANATVLVPMRFVMEGLGAAVDWNPASRTVDVRRGRYNMTLRIGRDYQIVNGKEVITYTPPRIVNGRTMVPIRFVSEALGGTVYWDNRTRTIQVTAPSLRAAAADAARP